MDRILPVISPITPDSTLLAIDSTTGPCSVAVWRQGRVTAYREELTTSMQSKRLICMVEEALNESGISYGALDAIAVTTGPGSFTGIRIGLAAARGIGFAAQIPVFGFNALEVLAFSAHTPSLNTPILAVLNAGKGEVAFQLFGADAALTPLSEPALSKPETLPQESVFRVGSAENTHPFFPRADWLAALAATHPHKHVAPLPFYVRPPDAKLPACAAHSAA